MNYISIIDNTIKSKKSYIRTEIRNKLCNVGNVQNDYMFKIVMFEVNYIFIKALLNNGK